MPLKIWQVMLFHGLITLLLAALFFAVGLRFELPGLFVGSAAILFNWVALQWAWQRIFLKKSIALAVSVIVFKYALLATILYQLVDFIKLRLIGFTVGLGSVLLTVILVAVMAEKNKRNGE